MQDKEITRSTQIDKVGQHVHVRLFPSFSVSLPLTSPGKVEATSWATGCYWRLITYRHSMPPHYATFEIDHRTWSDGGDIPG